MTHNPSLRIEGSIFSADILGKLDTLKGRKPPAPPHADGEADGLEKKNIAKDNPEVLSMIRAILARHPEAVAPGKRPGKGK